MASSSYRRPAIRAEIYTMHATLSTLWLALSGLAARKTPSRRRPAYSRPLLEALEDRTLPSTLTVLNILDSGAGSLRAAITAAKSGDTIVFAPALNGQTITLNSGELAIKKSLSIQGPGAGLLAVSGNDASRVFDLVSQGITVTITGLTVIHGLSSSAIGGGILNTGATLALANDILSNNRAVANSHNSTVQAAGGAAIASRNGATLTVSNCTFSGNQAIGIEGSGGNGGAILNGGWDDASPSTATITGCLFTDNQVVGGDGGEVTSGNLFMGISLGGGICNIKGNLDVKSCTFSHNRVLASNDGNGGNGSSGFYEMDIAKGGGLSSLSGNLIVSGSTFADNEAVGGSNCIKGASGQGRIGHAIGGGLETQSGTATVTNCTFDHNEAIGGNNNTAGSTDFLVGRGAGGGIGTLVFDVPDYLTVSGCTFTNNWAIGGVGNVGGPFTSDGIGGGLMNERGAVTTVTGCTFTGNWAIGGQGGPGQSGADGLGGGLVNVLGATLTVSCCTVSSNQAIGRAGGAGANGGNGFGGGVFNDGLSAAPQNAGTPATLTVTGSTIADNQAEGGAAGAGGGAGQGVGGGCYFATGGIACLDLDTVAAMLGNTASTSNNDLFGSFSMC
jgi:hypothetical protein